MAKVRTKINYILTLIIVLTVVSCNTTEPPLPGEKPTLALKLEDVSCTEAWIELTTTNLQFPTTVTLKQINPTGDTLSQVSILNTKDSLLFIDSLLPSKSYQYQVSSIENPATSNELSVTTMDTTSHNFTFEMLTFGTIGSSTLYDVAIINENNIWAVGEILIADTSQNGYTTYNAVHWDGINWKLMKIPYLFQGDSFYNPIYAIFAFNSNDIWFCGNGVIHLDGNSFIPITIPSSIWGAYQMNSIWGNNNNDIYIVGDGGNIAKHDGNIWQKIESGITLPILDIWGEEINPGEYEIICVASNGPSIPQDMALLRIKNNIVEFLPENDLPMNLNSVWIIRDKKYFLSGDGLFITDDPNNGWSEETNTLPYYKTNIRGTGYNNIFVVGAFGLVSHYNGVSWAHYTPIDARFRSVGAKDNIVVVVGRETGTNRAAILLGKQ